MRMAPCRVGRYRVTRLWNSIALEGKTAELSHAAASSGWQLLNEPVRYRMQITLPDSFDKHAHDDWQVDRGGSNAAAHARWLPIPKNPYLATLQGYPVE